MPPAFLRSAHGAYVRSPLGARLLRAGGKERGVIEMVHNKTSPVSFEIFTHGDSSELFVAGSVIDVHQLDFAGTQFIAADRVFSFQELFPAATDYTKGDGTVVPTPEGYTMSRYQGPNGMHFVQQVDLKDSAGGAIVETFIKIGQLLGTNEGENNEVRYFDMDALWEYALTQTNIFSTGTGSQFTCATGFVNVGGDGYHRLRFENGPEPTSNLQLDIPTGLGVLAPKIIARAVGNGNTIVFEGASSIRFGVDTSCLNQVPGQNGLGGISDAAGSDFVTLQKFDDVAPFTYQVSITLRIDLPFDFGGYGTRTVLDFSAP